MFKKRKLKSSNERLVKKSNMSESDQEESIEIQEIKASVSHFKKRKFVSSSSTRSSKSNEKDNKDEHKLKELSNTSGDLAATAVDTVATTGPLKPIPHNLKTTTITDFQPDVCKDYLQTGYCGYGDTCKFLHIRDESTQKKKIDKDWKIDTKAPKISEEVPFKCVLCKKEYKCPIKTQCDHIFCQECFFKRYKDKRKTKCFICGKETEGVVIPVNSKKLIELLNS